MIVRLYNSSYMKLYLEHQPQSFNLYEKSNSKHHFHKFNPAKFLHLLLIVCH